MVHVVCVEGVIGCGKSTLLKGLQAHGYKVLVEPLHEWMDVYRDNNGSILEHFYQDPTRWAFTFQVMALFTRAKAVKEAIEECEREQVPVLIIERSLLTTYQVFCKVLIQEGHLNTIESRLFRDVHESLLQGLMNLKYYTIHVKTHPDICLRRIQSRSRNGEEYVTLDYLMKLYWRHNGWLNMLMHFEINGDDTEENVLISALNYLRNMFD
jgi:deoxyadenosine/deoxycytidine kinase